VEITRPFSGALVPAEYYRRQPSVCAIMIEINRRLYIDEGSGVKLASFPEVAELIQGVLLRVFQWCRSRSAA
jgi:N-formylglutamate amidohydrolase